MLKSNTYFDGNVKSIAFKAPEGPATLGVMSPGTYEFTATTYEYMNVIAGILQVKFPDDEEWVTIEELETFVIEPGETFSIKAAADIAYFCFYSDTPLIDEDASAGACGADCHCNEDESDDK